MSGTMLNTGLAKAQNLEQDPTLVTGKLENGLSYVIKKHATPPGRASVWLHVNSGSLNETDKQRGIAHYLEHMAFNGSKNFKPGSVVPFFQELGLTFGQHQNAFTSFDQTTYQLALPNNKTETLDKGLLFMSDVAMRLALLPKEIDAERQIILEEKRSRMGAQQRVQEQIFKRIAPGSTFGERMPIGTEETVKGVMEPDFKDYYGTWYVPSNMTVIIVADMDEKTVAEHIKANFADGPKKPVPMNRPVGVKAATEPTAIVATDAELTNATVAIYRVRPPMGPATTQALARRNYINSLAMMAFDRRTSTHVREGTVSFQRGGGSIGDSAGALNEATVSAGGKPEKWREMLTDLCAEVARAKTFGFTDAELDLMKKEIISGLEQSVAMADTMPTQAIIGRINGDIAAGRPVRSSKQNLELANALLPTITTSELGEAFNAAFDPSGFVYVLQLPKRDDITIPSEAELLKLGAEAMKASVKEETVSATATTLLAKTPTPGTIAESQEHAATKITSAWLGNNIRVHHRFMDEQKSSVSVGITLIGGTIQETAANRGVTSAALTAWSRPATSTLTSTQINDLMTGKKVSVRGGAGGGGGRGGRGGGGGGDPDAVRLSVGGNPEELELGMQLAYLMLTDPKIEASALDQWKTRAKDGIDRQDKDVTARMAKVMASALYPPDEVRMQPLTKEQIDRITIEQAQAWLKKLIAECAIEVAIVGDIQRDRAMDLAKTYLGSLSKRTRVSPTTLASLRDIKRPRGARTASDELETQTDRAMVMSGFFGPDATDVAESRRMRMAARILSSRMIDQVREKEQLVYSIGASFRPGGSIKGYGMVTAAAPTDPAKVDRLVAKLSAMYDELAATGVTPEELEIAKKQMANTFDEQMKQPGYWSGVLDTMTFEATNLDDITGAPAAYQAMTADEIQAAVKRWHKPENMVSVVVKPKAGTAPAEKK
jgi:zinc protease